LVPLLVVAGIVFLYLVEVPRISPDQLRTRISTELPLGTKRSEIEAWLQSRGLSFRDIYAEKSDKRIGLNGEIPHIYRFEWMGSRFIQYTFYFDKDDKLIYFSVEGMNVCL
jgi:hypothetical protein